MLRDEPAAVLGDHRQGPLGEIAEVVGEVGVDAPHDRLVRVVAVLAERHLAQEEVAQGIDAVMFGERRRRDDVADRLRHLLAAIEQKPVHHDLSRQRQPGRHQEGWPEDRVKAADVLADDMSVGRPVRRARGRLVRVAGAGQVIGQRVDPDIHDVLRVVRHRNAPGEGGPADRKIVQPAADEAHDLVPVLLGRDEVGVVGVEARGAVRHRPKAGRNSSPLRPIRPAFRSARAWSRPAPERGRPRRGTPRRGSNTNPSSCRGRCRRAPPCGARSPARPRRGGPRWCGRCRRLRCSAACSWLRIRRPFGPPKPAAPSLRAPPSAASSVRVRPCPTWPARHSRRGA